MDNGDSLLDVIDYTSDFFGSQNDAASQIFDLADEFLGDNEADLSGSVIEESGNLATNVNQSNVLLTSQNFAVSSTKSTPQNTLVSSSSFLTTSSSSSSVASLLELQKAASMQQQQQNIVGQTVVNPLQNLASQTGLAPQLLQQGQQQFILKTASGQIQLSSQQQLQLQQQLLQHQQQQQQQVAGFQLPGTSPSPVGSSAGMLNRSGTPISGGLSISFGTPSTQTISTQLKRASPAPNVNIVHLPTNLQQQQQPQNQQQQQQFQIAPGAFLQIPSVSAGTPNLVNTALLQGQPTILGTGQQQGTLVNTQNTVIQNPNVVNVNVAAHHVLCNNTSQQQVQQQQQQQRPAMGLTSLQTATQSPFNIQGNLQGGQIQGTLIQTAEGKSILIPSQNIAHPINIQQLSVATPMGTQPVQQPQGNMGNMIQLTQANVGGLDNRSTNQALPQIMVNGQGQQILVQRAGASASPQQMTQNIIVRAPGGQSGIVQFQQRAASQQPQIQGHTQTIQALAAAASGGQQLKIISQQGSGSQGLPMINIGGQNVSLQTLSSQLGNIQGLQLLQQQGQVTMQQQQSGQAGHVTLQQGQPVSFQPQVSSGSTVIMQQNQGIGQGVQPQSGVMFMAQSGTKTSSAQVTGQYSSTQMIPQPNQTVSQSQMSQVKVDSSSDSVEAQTQQILQRIHNQLQMSQANSAMSRSSPSIGTRVASFSTSTAPNVTVQHIKQEQAGKSSCFSTFTNNAPQPVIKSEPNTLEALVKQESHDSKNSVFGGTNTLSQAATISGQTGMLGNSGQSTSVTTTVSTATTQMSLFVVSNSSQGVISNSSGLLNTSASFSSLANSSLSNNSPMIASAPQVSSANIGQNTPATLQMAGQVRPARATLQTIQLPPELQQQFQRVQQEIKKIQSMTNVTAMHKQRLQQLQNVQRHILLKGRVLATTKAEPHHIQQGLAALTQSGLTVSQSGSETQMLAGSSGQALEQQPKTPSSQAQYSASVNSRGATPGQDSALPDSTSSLGQCEGQGQTLSTLLSTTNSQSQPPTPSFVQSTLQSQQSTNLNSSQGSSMNTQLATSVSTMSCSTMNQQQGTSMTPQQGGSRTTAMETTTIATTAVSSTPQVAVPTQIKIANKVLTLSLTPAQRDKVQSYLDRMTPEQQQQYLQTQQHVLSKIQKQQHMNAQIMAQVEQQKKLAATAPAGATPPLGQALKQSVATVGQAIQNTAVAPGSTVDSQSAVKVAELKTIPVPVGLSQPGGATDLATPVRGIKRSYMDIPKGTLINQQIRQDQNHAVNPDTKRPFRSRSDACRRLLRYHVFQSYGPSPSELASFDSSMEDLAQDLLQKKDRMFERFRVLLMQETIRAQQSSELVMLQRMQNQDLRKQIEEEKLLVKTNPGAFQPMPMRFLCKMEGGLGDHSTPDVKLEPRSDSGAEDRTEDDDSNDAEVDHIVHQVKDEPEDSDQESKTVRMKKLVIKSDGQNFRSSFKRNSLDSSHSSVEEVLDTSDYSNEGTTGDSQSGAQGRESREGFTEEDEDTNDYSDKYYSLQDEAAQAAMAISSAEESQDSQMDVEVESELYRKYHVAGPRHSVHSISRLAPGAGNKNGSLELASESIYYSNTPREGNSSKHSSRVFPSFNDKDEDYIPSHSPVSNESGEGNEIGAAAANGIVQGVENTDYLDKFNMYQPITESLTDSEENSYYSADNSAEHPSVMRGEGRANVETIPQFIDSDSEEQESDQEVKAQMESAINSILSLSQGVTNESHSVYKYSQSNQLFQSGGQSDSVTHNNASSSSEREGFVRETDRNSDLESAVNSILM